MKKALLFLLFAGLLIPIITLAQNSSTTSPSKNTINADAVQERYDLENEKWRLNIILFILKNETAKLNDTISEMDKFTSTTVSYIDLKRKGYKEAQKLYYLNLENITKIKQLQKSIKNQREAYPEFTKDFLSKYKITEKIFDNFSTFEKTYEKILDQWRSTYENELKAKNTKGIKSLSEDMKILKFSINAFILFPGKSAAKVPQLQKMENDLRHAIAMLKMQQQTITNTQ